MPVVAPPRSNDPDFCNVASGWEKEVVEKNVQDSRRRIWIDAGK